MKLRYTLNLWAALSTLVITVPAHALRIEGTVRGSEGSPLAGAQIDLITDQSNYRTPETVAPLATAKSLVNGTFSIDAPETGTVALLASAPGHRRMKFPINPVAAQGKRVGLALEPGIEVQGRVVDEAGAPVAGAILGPLVPGSESDRGRWLRSIPQWTMSDSDGRFEFKGLDGEIGYTFVAQAPTYEMNNVLLGMGETRIEFPLRRGGSGLTGSVYSKLSPATAFVGTEIRTSGNNFHVMTRVGDDGNFAVAGLPEGDWLVEAILPPNDQRAVRTQMVKMPTLDGTSVSLEVTSGYYASGVAIDQETSTTANGVAIRINDTWTTSGSDGRFRAGPLYTASQTDIAVDEESGFRVYEISVGNEMGASDGFQNLDDVVVRVNRRRTIDVTLGGIEFTTSTIDLNVHSATNPGMREAMPTSQTQVSLFERSIYHVFVESGGLMTEVSSVTLEQDFSASIALQLAPAASIRGRAVMTGEELTTRPRIFNISLKTGSEETSDSLISQAATAVNGYYSFSTLPFGNFVIEAANPSRTRVQTRNISLRPGGAETINFDFEPGKLLAGTVKSAEGVAIPGARVTWRMATGEMGTVECDNQGAFRAEDLLTSSIAMLTVDTFGFAPFRRMNIPLPQENLDIRLAREGALQVRVDSETAVKFDVILMRMAPWGRGAYVDQIMGQQVDQSKGDPGEVLQFSSPGEGKFRAVAVSPDKKLVGVSEEFIRKETNPEAVEIVVQPGSTGGISGTTGQSDSSVAVNVSALNTCLPENGMVTEFEVESQNGRYTFTGIPPGDYLLLGSGENFNASATNIRVPAGGNITANLEATALQNVAGVITLAGQPAVGVDMEILSETDSSFVPRRTTTNAQGQFEFPDIQADSYAVRANMKTADGEVKGQRSIRVVRNQVVPPINMDLAPPKPVSIQFPPAMAITAGSMVTLMNIETRNTFTGTWNEAMFEISAPAGNYEVWNGDQTAGKLTIQEDGSIKIDE